MEKNFTLVTGSDSKYFDKLKNVLANIHKINKEKYRVVVYDLGLEETEINFIKNKYPDVILEHFDYDLYPDHVSLIKYPGRSTSYAWKPIIFHEVCEKYGGVVIWFDTRNLFTNLKKLFILVKSVKIYSSVSSGTVSQWTHKTTMNYMEGHCFGNFPERNGALIGIDYTIEWCKKFIEEWKNYSLIRDCIMPEGSSRKNHRQDQAVLSILFYKYLKQYKFRCINPLKFVTIHNN